MFSISFEADIGALSRQMPDWAQRRIPSITRNALNDAAEDGVFSELDTIKGVFDRPTPFTQKAVVFPASMRATSSRLEAVVMVRDQASGGTPPSKYLLAQVTGGGRKAKPFEHRLRRAGIMRMDEYATVAIGYRRNAYGNLPGPTLVAILSQLQAAEQFAGYAMNETRRSRAKAGSKRVRRYFVPPEGSGLPRGVYERVGKRIKAVLIFVSQPTYRKRYEFGRATINKARRVFPAYWRRHFYAELAKQLSR